MKLRYYQQEAIDAVWQHFTSGNGYPCVVMPTASGKTIVIASLAKEVARAGDRVLILSHVKELVEQSAEKLHAICPDVEFGIYSAGLGKRQIEQQIIVAGIQSVYNKADLLGAFDLIIIDECHLIGNTETGMYRTLLADLKKRNPHFYLVGLTATPYRMSTGFIYGPDQLFDSVCYEIGIKTLITSGYLSDLTSKASKQENDTDHLHIQRGEFIAAEMESLFTGKAKVQNACQEIVDSTRDRKSVLIFCSGIKHAEMVVNDLRARDKTQHVEMIDGSSASLFRDETIQMFREGKIKYLVNVNVLTTGFDAPNVDCVVLLRATMSPGLLVQMIGRGFRIHDDKKDCLILDFGNNILRHGPVDAIHIRQPGDKTDRKTKRGKKCPDCQTVVALAARICPDCGYAFGIETCRHEGESTGHAPLAGKQNPVEEFEIIDATASVHQKKNDPSAPTTMKMTYTYSHAHPPICQWLCFNHKEGSFAHGVAKRWWLGASDYPVPDSTEDAVGLFNAGACAMPVQIKARLEERFYKIIEIAFGDKPKTDHIELTPAEPKKTINWDEVPF